MVSSAIMFLPTFTNFSQIFKCFFRGMWTSGRAKTHTR